MSEQAKKLQSQIDAASRRMAELPDWIKINCKLQGNVKKQVNIAQQEQEQEQTEQIA